ncbi:hypothetical protein [Winogradskyella wichelsiae]|jgi:hypothetical protein|uniref:hypothetical protein n=1 Tax=Winogradskyella wichelsiae TaxID=2697007 RepID=UPI0015C7F0FD|nr:hypothetical protein [Winogradskyella wichelsiae]
MKSLKITIGLFSTLLLASCGSTIESDAQKLADLMCKSQKMTQQIQSGELDASDANKSAAFAMEAAKLQEEIEGKYSSKEELKEFENAVLKAMKNCE